MDDADKEWVITFEMVDEIDGNYPYMKTIQLLATHCKELREDHREALKIIEHYAKRERGEEKWDLVIPLANAFLKTSEAKGEVLSKRPGDYE